MIRREDLVPVVRAWWQQFDPAARGGGRQGSLRGDLAELRRCQSLQEVALSAGFFHLLAEMRHRGLLEGDHAPRTEAARESFLQRTALLAGVLAHVAEDVPLPERKRESFARQMAGAGTTPAVAPISDLRFRKLLRATEAEDLFRQLSRVLRQMGGRADLDDLTRQLWQLSSPDHETTRRDWALAYYEVAPLEKTK